MRDVEPDPIMVDHWATGGQRPEEAGEGEVVMTDDEKYERMQPPHGWSYAVEEHGKPRAVPIDPAPWVGGPGTHRRRGSTAMTVLLTTVAIVATLCGMTMLIGACAMSGDGGGGFGRIVDPKASDTGRVGIVDPDGYGLGEAFTSGPFQYTVTEVTTGLESVGDSFSKHPAQGGFVRLDVTVTNVGSQPEVFDGDFLIRVVDTDGREFSADSQANIIGNEDSAGWLTEVNPGNTVQAGVFFDLPDGADPDKALVAAGLLTFEPDAVVYLN